MSGLLELVERLEEIGLEELFDEPEEMALRVAERQTIVDELAAADATLLSEDERAEFKRRVADVLARDQQLMLQLTEKREEILKALEHARSARRASNGYAQILSSPPPSSRRFG